ncbi:MAG: hypothetical protein GPJ54_08395 [Candidatus Heimdallarchaeota archaeon]|nr:hypothetical protein [Candidatus Heimdallarchaeota archaeon]
MSDDPFDNSFTSRHLHQVVNLGIPDKYTNLDYSERKSSTTEEFNSKIISSKYNFPNNITISINNILSSIQIINAPGTIISNLNLLNTSIELMNSPNSLIMNNRIHNLSNTSALSAISITNSSNTKILNNIIEDSSSSDGEMMGILVNSSLNVEIHNNTINNLSSEINNNLTSISLGILISNSTYSNITNNQITNIFGVSTSAIVIEKGEHNRITSNIISDIETFSTDRSESFGILLVNTSNNLVENNNLQNIFANNYKARSFAFGISLTGVSDSYVIENNISVIEAIADRPDSFGIHLASSSRIEIKGNYIEKIFTHSDIERRAFSTGIYMSHSDNLIITQNSITKIITEGRASYAIYADNSNMIEISNNLIYDLFSISKYQNTADGIIIRIVNNLIISKNNISEIESLTINDGNNLAIPSAIGILVDNIINSTITKNYIENINSIGNAIPTDSIGILASSNQYATIQNNTISKIYSNKYDSFSIGITSHSSSNLKIIENKIDKIQSDSNSILMYQAFSKHVSVSDNSIIISGDGEKINGIYSVKNFNETVLNNKITSNHQIIGAPAIFVSFNELFTVLNNNLNDVINNSIGIVIRSGNNGIIRGNYITNFLLWMQMTVDSISVACDANRIDNNIHEECIVGEFHDLVSLENEIQNNFVTDNFDDINTNNEFQFENPEGNSGSLFVLFIILPIILAAISSVLVKRKQIKGMFVEFE